MMTEKISMERLKKVLLIEDNEIAQRIPILILEKERWVVDVAATGRAALVAISRSTYDLILLDIGLPDIDGYRLAEIMCAKINNESMPIIALTAHDNLVPEKRSAINELYHKPFTAEIYQKIIEKYFIKDHSDSYRGFGCCSKCSIYIKTN